MELKEFKKQTNAVSKKVTAVITAFTLLAGTVIGTGLHKKHNSDVTTSISVSDTTLNNEDMYDDLALSEDFDINDPEAVKQRANDIYNISKKEVSVKMIINLLYLVNGKYKAIKFPESGDKFKYLQDMFIALSEVLDDNFLDDSDRLTHLISGDDSVLAKDDKEVYAYMLMATRSVKTKKEAFELARLANKQLENIENGDVDAIKTTAKEYYVFVKELVEKIGKVKNNGYNYATLASLAAINTIMTPLLNKEEQKFLDSNLQNIYSNALSGEVNANLGINPSLDEGIKDGDFGNKVYIGEKYNSKDAVVANKRPEAGKVTGSKTNKDKVSNGGKKVTNSTGTSEVIKKPGKTPSTTTVIEESWVANVPSVTKEVVVEEGGKVVEEKDTTKKEQTTTKPVESTTKYEETTTKPVEPTTKHEETTTKPKEATTISNEITEIVEEGGEVVWEGSLEEAEQKGYYVDADVSSSLEVGTSKVITK